MSHNLIELRRRHRVATNDNALTRLQSLMEAKREISPDDLREVARAAGVPAASVYGVATYYGDLGLKPRGRTRVKVCRGTACLASGGNDSVRGLEEGLALKLDETREDGAVSLEPAYCLGHCHAGPAVAVEQSVYVGVTEQRARELGRKLATGEGASEDEMVAPHFEAHHGPAIILERLAKGVDATVLRVAREHDVYEGLAKALSTLSPEDVLREVEESKLRGRGGAGFATATKWRFAAANARSADQAYLVCNADEGDPGSYIDKWIMERDPFALIEGMTLAAYAIGASRGYIYVRSEYTRAAPLLERAVRDARAAALLGDHIQGREFSFDIEVVVGAGSYVCGEETALLRSLEGLRGMVTARPPFPAERGLFEKPTVVNNVETLANIGWIVRHGGDAYAAIGHGTSRGTKALSLNERFVRPGIYEVPFGTTLREVFESLAQGLKGGRRIKAVQIGGPLGGILPNALLDTKLGFEELDAVGALLGHGGVVAWDETVDVRDIAEHLFDFSDRESCGKCVPCRLGGRRGLELVRRLKTQRPVGEADADIALLGELIETMRYGSLCAHGEGIPMPIAALLLHFPAEMNGGVR